MSGSHHKKAQIVLLIAIITTFIMLYVGLQAADMVVRGMKGGRHWEVSLQARDTAQSAKEVCLYQTKNKQAFSWPWQQMVDLSSGPISTTGSCEVRGLAECYPADLTGSHCVDANLFYVPKAGFGSAGEQICNPKRYNPKDPADTTPYQRHACNWNRLYFGEKINIPLFQTQSDGTVTNPADIWDFDGFSIRFRTPCKVPYQKDGSCLGERFELPFDDSDKEAQSVIATWQLTTEKCQLDDTCVLYPISRENDLSTDTNIQVGDFNNPLNPDEGEIILNQETLGRSPQILEASSIEEFLQNNPFKWPGNTIEKATLQLSFIGQLTDEAGGPIPYLEYQIVYEGAPLGDTVQTIFAKGTAQAGGDTYGFELVTQQSSQINIIDFVIQN